MRLPLLNDTTLRNNNCTDTTALLEWNKIRRVLNENATDEDAMVFLDRVLQEVGQCNEATLFPTLAIEDEYEQGPDQINSPAFRSKIQLLQILHLQLKNLAENAAQRDNWGQQAQRAIQDVNLRETEWRNFGTAKNKLSRTERVLRWCKGSLIGTAGLEGLSIVGAGLGSGPVFIVSLVGVGIFAVGAGVSTWLLRKTSNQLENLKGQIYSTPFAFTNPDFDIPRGTELTYRKLFEQQQNRLLQMRLTEMEGADCPICLDKNGQVVTQVRMEDKSINYQGPYHEECLNPWLSEHSTDPKSKQEVLRVLDINRAKATIASVKSEAQGAEHKGDSKAQQRVEIKVEMPGVVVESEPEVVAELSAQRPEQQRPG